MDSKATGDEARHRRRLRTAIRGSLRELSVQFSLLNGRVSARLGLREVDLDCLDLIARHGPFTPSALARRTGLHPATVTGILDRLERGGWITRSRDPEDRRAVRVHAVRDRGGEIFKLFAGMNARMEEIYADYDDAQLELLADFLTRTVAAGRVSSEELETN
jgi:DNA-binding MarR family transcriptional regulator